MSNNTYETMDAVGRTSEEEINFILGDKEFDIDQALQEGGGPQEDGPQMDGQKATAATMNPKGGNDLQTSIIDAALEDLEEDLKFDGITFDQHHDEFTGMPSLMGYASMGMSAGFNNFDNFQYNTFNYPPPPPVYNTMPNTGYYNTGFNNTNFNNIGFHNTTMPMFAPNPTPCFPSDLGLDRNPLSRASMQVGMFSSDLGGDIGFQYPAMAGTFPTDLGMHAELTPIDLGGDIDAHYRGPLKKRRVEKADVGRPVTLAEQPEAYGPFHLVPIKESAVLDMGEAAVAAREARKVRRKKRAKGHILYLLDASVSEIETAAVADADYSDPYDFGLSHDEQCEQLLRDYMNNFDAKMFVEGAWDGIYLALSSAKKSSEEEVKVVKATTTKAVVNEVKSTKSSSINSVAANLIHLMRRKPGFSMDAPDDDIGSDLSSSTTLKLPNNTANVSSNPGTPKSQGIIRSNHHIVTPTASDVAQTKKRRIDGSIVSHTKMALPFVPSNLSSKTGPSSPAATPSSSETMEPQQQIDMLADLPAGSDKESRRQRRLMRNRLSAQRSRDKRRRDIAVYTKLKAQKVEEIASMKKTVTEEMEGLKKLEEMVKFAKTFLGPAKFATVVSKWNE